MNTGLIGFTGFVGSNIDAQAKFEDKYNSTNINQIANKEYDLLVCAGARAEKWRINQEPEKDLAEIKNLISHLQKVKTKKFVLISTTDVYKTPAGVDELTQIDTDGLHAYGKNRFMLEQFCSDKFDTLIVRLPGLFGRGLKKNVIYDLMHDNNVEKIHHGGSFQYYNLRNIWRDINIALDNKLSLINFATEPLLTSEIASECFGIDDFSNEPDGVIPGSYDMHTIHAELYGKEGNYIYNKSEELSDITQFVESDRNGTSL